MSDSEDEDSAQPKRLPKRTLRAQRTQTKRMAERDMAEDNFVFSDDGEQEDEEDDDFYGKRGGTKGKKRRSAVLQAVESKKHLPLLKPAITAAAPKLDADFMPLKDLQGATAMNVVGRRIRVWYDIAGESDEYFPSSSPSKSAVAAKCTGNDTEVKRPSSVKPSVGVVTFYGSEGRLHAVYDGEEEFDGLWIDGNDEWEWVDDAEVGPPPPPPPRAGLWRPQKKACELEGSEEEDVEMDIDRILGKVGDLDKIFLVRAADGATPTGDGTGLELYVKWKGMAHMHCQWVPRQVLEESDPINKRRVVKFLKDVASSLPEGVTLETLQRQPTGAAYNADGQMGDEEPFNPEVSISTSLPVSQLPLPLHATHRALRHSLTARMPLPTYTL